ncbi:DUF6236 family protein [Vibrio alginolyticus]|uniref:DUF6236 family protein n=1 Tax=Vibrio alginolyticus TaxID=663 RepID=UPI00375485DE
MDRGIVITPNYSIMPNGGLQVRGGVDATDLRQYMLFWDKIDYPTNNIIHYAGGPDIEFLKDIGMASSTEVRFERVLPHENGTIFLNAQMATYEKNSKNEDEEWSIAQPNSSLTIPEGYSVNQGSLIFELYNAIQIPTPEVPLEDIKRFKDAREPELLSLRDSMDNIVDGIMVSGDIPKRKTKALSKLHRDLNDFNRVMKETGFQRVKRSLKTVATDPWFGVSGAAGVLHNAFVEDHLPDNYKPYAQLLNVAALGACAARFAYREMRVGRDIPQEFKQFAYLNSIKREFNV